MTQFNTDGKKIAIVGLVTGLIVAGMKGRQLHDAAEASAYIPANPLRLSRTDLKEVVTNAFSSLGSKRLSTLAAGVAYYSVLAFFPFVAATVAIAALVISPEQLTALVSVAQHYLPADISSILTSMLQNLVSNRSDNILTAIIAIIVALYGASGASKSLVIASNVAYEVNESRGWLAQQLWGVLWTIGGIVFIGVTVALLAINNTILEHIGLTSIFVNALLYGRWIVLLICCVLGLSIFYRYGPNRPRAKLRWINWGALFATTAWLIATSFFFIYVQNFANYSQSYSLFAGIIILMIWMNFSALIVLLGAEINYQLVTVGKKKKDSFLTRALDKQ